MKYLKIDDNKGYFLRGEELVEIDKINKDDLLVLLNHAQEDEFEMDPYVADNIQNKAHQIIYQNIHAKLSAFLADKEQFDKAVDSMYQDAIGEYGADVEAEDIDEPEVESTPTTDEEEINPEDIPF